MTKQLRDRKGAPVGHYSSSNTETVRCEICDQRNDNSVERCTRCGAALPVPKPEEESSSSSDPKFAGQALMMLVWTTVAICLFFVAARAGWKAWDLKQLVNRQEEERTAQVNQYQAEALEQEEQHRARLEQMESAHQSRLNDRALMSGEAARASRSREWTRRMAHDPSLASTAIEKTLLRMQSLGLDPAYEPQNALEQVAMLAAPTGSRVEVRPEGNAFTVRVAFRMSALSKEETGAVTKHHTTASMRAEVQQLCARVVKDLYDYCGSRGIGKISVSCNHTVRQALIPRSATGGEKQELLKTGEPVMDSLYRASLGVDQARTVSDWRQISIPQVETMLTTEYDGLATLTISGGNPDWYDRVDAGGVLKF